MQRACLPGVMARRTIVCRAIRMRRFVASGRGRMYFCSLAAWRAKPPAVINVPYGTDQKSKIPEISVKDIRRYFALQLLILKSGFHCLGRSDLPVSQFSAVPPASFSIDMNSSPVIVSFSYRNCASLSRLLRFSRSIFLAFSCCCFTSCTTFLSISF